MLVGKGKLMLPTWHWIGCGNMGGDQEDT
jgi:hypothetical protein